MRGAYILAGLLIAGASVVAGVFAYGHFNRFVTANSADGFVYVIDRRTGEATMIKGGARLRVADVEKGDSKPDSFSKALDLAKRYHEFDIGIALGDSSKTYEVLPWRIYQANDQTFFVQSRVAIEGTRRSRAFEVNLVTQRSRFVDEEDTPSLWAAFKDAEKKGVFRDFDP